MSHNPSPSQGDVCPVCLETKRDAHLLPCLHSLCRSCIDNLAITSGKEAPCPVCRETFAISESGARTFPKDTVTSSGRPEAKCDECGDERVAMFCGSCQVFLCSSHIGGHCVAKSGKKRHLLTKISEPQGADSSEAAKADASLEFELFPSCSDHGERVAYLCLDCDKSICGQCAILGEHRRHNVKHAREIIQRRKEEVGKKLDRLRVDIEPLLVKAVADVDGVSGQLTARAVHVRNEICSATDKGVQTVQTVGAQLLQEVNDIVEERSKLLDEQQDSLKHQLDSVRNAINFGNRLLEQELRPDCLAQLIALEQRVGSLRVQEMVLKPVTHAKLGFQCVEDNALPEKAFQTTGHLLSFRGSARHSIFEGSTHVYGFHGRKVHPATFVLQVKDEQNAAVEGNDAITTRWSKLPEGETSQVSVAITSQHNSGRYLLSTRPSLPGKYELEVAVNGEALSCCLSVEVVRLMQFDTNACDPGIEVSSDGHCAAVTQGQKSDLRPVLGSLGMRKGRFSWKIQISSTLLWHCLGIASKSTWQDPHQTYSLSSDGKKFGEGHGSKPKNQWSPNDCIDFQLDCEKHTLQITNMMSGKCHKITGLPDKEFFVWVCLLQPGNSAEFVG